ncbi:Exodeoxyribonuclease VII [Saliniradius amylolyticus]|uniref:Exodeoxyribonuclease 7 small subunit n=2 Tax=Saliniradius amylolyticus TaxID=2183582 RepID=A0A2S2E473_9ALTE|nr:Exodeoxyribonuclease VII [Saliniradius amylolyticus]
MQELETIVEQMEAGELPLEEALQRFERGIALTQQGQQKLQQAEQKVKMLLAEQGQENLVDFEPEQ